MPPKRRRAGVWPTKGGRPFEDTEDAANFFFNKLLSNVPIAGGKSYVNPIDSVKAREQLFKVGIAYTFGVDTSLAGSTLAGGSASTVAKVASMYRAGIKELIRILSNPTVIQDLMIDAVHNVVQVGYLSRYDFTPKRSVGLTRSFDESTGKGKKQFWDNWSNSGFSEGVTQLKLLLTNRVNIARGSKGNIVSVGLPTLKELLAIRTHSKSRFNSIFMMLEFGTGSEARPLRPYSSPGATPYKVSPGVAPYIIGQTPKQGSFYLNPLAAELQRKLISRGGKLKPTEFSFPVRRVKVNKGQKKDSRWKVDLAPFTSYFGAREFSGAHQIFELRKQAVLIKQFRALADEAFQQVLVEIEKRVRAVAGKDFPSLITNQLVKQHVKNTGTLGVFSF